MANKNSGSNWTMNKVAFWSIAVAGVCYLLSLLFGLLLPALSVLAHVLQAVATAAMIIIVAILAWRHVKSKAMVWKVLYVVCLLLVILGVIIPFFG